MANEIIFYRTPDGEQRIEVVSRDENFWMPQKAIAELFAVAHRDYTSTGSVQVMLLADRLEIWNPGALPPGLTPESLRRPHGSFPHNPLLAEALYLTQYIERMGTGTGDMIRRCHEAGLPEPEFRQDGGFTLTIRRRPESRPELRPELRPESRPESASLETRVLKLLEQAPLSKSQLSDGLGHRDISGRLKKVLLMLLAEQAVEHTIPEKPTSRLQRYRLTEKGRAWLEKTK